MAAAVAALSLLTLPHWQLQTDVRVHLQPQDMIVPCSKPSMPHACTHHSRWAQGAVHIGSPLVAAAHAACTDTLCFDTCWKLALGVQEDQVWAEVAKADVKPLIEEEARLSAEVDMRVLVTQLRVRRSG